MSQELSRSALQAQVEQVSDTTKDKLSSVADHFPDVFVVALDGELRNGISYEDGEIQFDEPSWVLRVEARDPRGIFAPVSKDFTPDEVPLLFAAFEGKEAAALAVVGRLEGVIASLRAKIDRYEAQVAKVEKLLS